MVQRASARESRLHYTHPVHYEAARERLIKFNGHFNGLIKASESLYSHPRLTKSRKTKKINIRGRFSRRNKNRRAKHTILVQRLIHFFSSVFSGIVSQNNKGMRSGGSLSRIEKNHYYCHAMVDGGAFSFIIPAECVRKISPSIFNGHYRKRNRKGRSPGRPIT